MRAVIAQTAQPIVRGELKKLRYYQEKKENLSVEDILEAFLTPAFEVILNGGEGRIGCARFMGRCRLEPDPVRRFAEQEFADSQEAFLDALSRSLPDLSRTELRWKLDLVIAVLLRVLTEANKPGSLIQDNDPNAIESTVSKLVNFLAPALRS